MKDNIRNFSIIAHIDHGKTTLTDRLLEITKTVDPRLMKERFLDSHPISQEKGVTIKLAPVRMEYKQDHKNYTLNLIDTPGHVDFSYEVSRSLAACEGAVLLVDATQGIQAQTVANTQAALKQELVLIPVVNKIDMPNAQPDEVANEMSQSLGFDKKDIIFISAKTGKNVNQVLKAVVNKIPQPKRRSNKPLRALVFDSFYHSYKGVVIYVKIVDGKLEFKKTKSKLQFLATNYQFEPLEIGVLVPQMKKQNSLENGQVGYIATGLKDVSLCQVGDTVATSKLKQLAGYQEPKPVVFFDFYPVDNQDFNLLKEALEQLKLNDFSLSFSIISSPALGKGYRLGFLGVFHALITQERLERDFNLEIVITSPSVEYQIIEKSGVKKAIQNAAQIKDISKLKEIQEPWIKASVYTPVKYLGGVFDIFKQARGELINQEYYGSYVQLEYQMPLVELISGFYDQLKSVSSGFASLDYQLTGFKPFKATKLEVLINKQNIEALSLIVEKSKGERMAKNLAKKLKKIIPRQQFEVPIQISLNNKIVARETIKAFRRDVTAKLYGGDQTRKDKLLKKQKKGKKRLKQIGNLTIPQEAFMAALEID